MANDNEKNTLTQDYVKGLITDYDFVRSHIVTALISKERKENNCVRRHCYGLQDSFREKFCLYYRSAG